MDLWSLPRWCACATATPIDTAGRVDVARLLDHLAVLFDGGVDAVALFGTTGEGPSFGMAERRQVLEAVLAGGVAPGRLIVGVGCPAIDDGVALARHALGVGCETLLALPPFFFKGVGDAGVVAAFSRMVDGIDDAHARILLYHIPSVTGVAVSAAATRELASRYPGIVAGIKDSGADLAASLATCRALDGLAVTVGAEHHVQAVMAAGGRGTICGLANLEPALTCSLVDGDVVAGAEMEALAARFQSVPFVPALKVLLAERYRDPAWAAVLPPLQGLPA